MKDLKEKTLRGAFARLCAQIANFVIRLGSLVVLARLLNPSDFGLVGMVTAFTGLLNLFRDFGLSAATVQRVTVTKEQTSTLFWINLLVGALLTLFAILLAPVVAAFYHEPRLFWVANILAIAFLFNAAGIQHSALLQRQMRFTTLSMIDIGSLLISTGIAVCAAKAGYGYWALVVMTVTLPLTTTVAFWVTTAWIPGRPRRRSGIRAMLRYGGTLTVTGVVVYIASNFEKVLLGRFWGAEAIGLYGRAYQLSRIPTDNLNSAVGEVAFSALSRLQDDPIRLKSYFLKGYSLVLALTVPATFGCGLFADDVVTALLGPKWKDAAQIFRLLAPTILVFAIANPLSWLVSALGLVVRGLNMSLVIAPIMIGGYLVGLSRGPDGVACAYSVVMILWVIPVVLWSIHGTVISFKDILAIVSRPLVSSVAAGAAAFAVRLLPGQSATQRLLAESAVLLVVYLVVLLLIMDQKVFYLNLLRSALGHSRAQKDTPVPA